MTANRLVRVLVVTVGAIVAVGQVGAGEGDGPAHGAELGFFEDDAMTFDGPPAPSAPPPPPSAAGDRDPPGPAQPAYPAPAPVVAAPIGPAAPGRAPSPPARGARPHDQRAPGSRVERAPAVIPPSSGPREVEVLRVRPLKEEERARTKGAARCANPLMADVRLGGRLRAIAAREARVAPEKVPGVVSWLFSERERCFDRSRSAAAAELDAIDAAARDAVRREGRK